MARLRPVDFEDRLTLVEHLDELRTRIVISIAAFVVAFGLCFWQNDRLLDIANAPLPGDRDPITFGVAEPFTTGLKVSFYAALAIALDEQGVLPRQAYVDVDGVLQPAAAPRFSRTPPAPQGAAPPRGQHAERHCHRHGQHERADSQGQRRLNPLGNELGHGLLEEERLAEAGHAVSTHGRHGRRRVRTESGIHILDTAATAMKPRPILYLEDDDNDVLFLRCALQAAEVDLLTEGRFRLGLGVGWNPVEYEALGEDFRTRGARLDEQVVGGVFRRLPHRIPETVGPDAVDRPTRVAPRGPHRRRLRRRSCHRTLDDGDGRDLGRDGAHRRARRRLDSVWLDPLRPGKLSVSVHDRR